MSRNGKGYAFVSLPRDIQRIPREYTNFHRRVPGALSGKIDITLAAEQPVHVGSGSKRAWRNQVVYRGVTIAGRPGIPGASLKGVLRSRYEAMTCSCTSPPRAASVRSTSREHIKSARFAKSALDTPVFSSRGNECKPGRTCPACALFGCMSLRSRITVTDIACDSDIDFDTVKIPERFSPNIHHVGDSDVVVDRGREIFEVRKLYGRKFARGRGPVPDDPTLQQLEVIAADRLVRGQIRLFNVMPAVLGGLLAALGRAPASSLKVGGGKAHGLGRMRCVAMDYRLRDAKGNEVAADETVWRQCFEDSPGRFAQGEARLVAIHQGDC